MVGITLRVPVSTVSTGLHWCSSQSPGTTYDRSSEQAREWGVGRGRESERERAGLGYERTRVGIVEWLSQKVVSPSFGASDSLLSMI